MILWDRIKRNFDDGLDAVMKASHRVSERARIEVRVARLMIDKGSLETKLDRLHRRLGERVSFLHEQKDKGILNDPEVMDALRAAGDLKEEIGAMELSVQKASLGRGEE